MTLFLPAKIITVSLRDLFKSGVIYYFYYSLTVMTSLCMHTQGVLKVRKRVTLMLVTITAIFVICWVTDLTLHVIESGFSYQLSPVAIPIAHTMIMFNSAVNPFAYALINQRFREKMKAMVCCISNSSVTSAARDREGVELDSTNIQPTDTAELSSRV